MQRIVGISETAEALGASVPTRRCGKASGKLIAEPKPGGRRRDELAKLRPERFRAPDVNPGSKVIATKTRRGTLKVWPQALRRQPVERNALARFARPA